jgi:hypothetical protein
MKKIKILSVLLILSFVSIALGQSVSEVWKFPADDANAAAWQSAGNARGIDFNANSTHTGNTVIIADNAGNTVHVHDAADGSYLWSLDTTGVGPVFTGHTVSPYRVAVTEDGQIFVNSFDGIIVKWADDAASTAPEIVIDLSAVSGNSRSLEAVGSGNNVRIFFSKGTDIRVFDDNGTGAFVESVGRTIATGWTAECEAIASADSNLVYASKIGSGGDQKPFRRVYELTATGYVNNETLVAALPYTSWFQPNGLDVGNGYYVLAEAAGSYDGFAIGTIDGANYNPESGDTDGDNVYDSGMNGASAVADIAIDPTTLHAYWTTAGTGATAGIGCIKAVEPPPPSAFDWELNVESYSFFKNDHRTRGIAYNPATGHLLIASRTGGNDVFILDAATGDSLSKLDMTGISGGTYAMNIIRVDSDGVIYLGNLGGISGSPFKIYRWENESAVPTVAFEGTVAQRTGDSFGLYGTGTSTILYASGSGSTDIYAFTTSDGISFTITDTVTVASGLARGGISPIGNGEFWVNGAGTSTSHIASDGSVIAAIDGSLVDTGWHNVAYIPTSGGRKLVAVIGKNVPDGNQVQVWDITSSETDTALLDTVDLTSTYNVNTNATGDLAFKDNGDGTITIYEMITNNGIAAWTLAVPPAIPIHPEPKELYTWWEKNAGDYTFFQSDNNTRGMDLNPVTGNLLVASRTGSDSIHILEGENGNYLGSMDMTNVTGGVFAINLVSVANDGVIYGCNLTTTGAGFKFYRWGDESSAPTVAFEGDLDQRVGDSFTVIGSGANTIVYASGSNATKIYIFTTTDGISFSLFDEVPILSSLARGGIAPVADTLGSDIWVNCSGKQAALIDTGGTVITTIDTSMNTFFAHIDYFETGDGRKLIAVAGGNCGDVPACMRSEVWDVTNPFNPWRFAYGSMTNTPVANVNGTGIAILEEKEDGVLNLYHLLSNNGIALYCAEEIIIHPEPEELYTWWEKNAGDYTFFQSDNNTRGMDLNPVTGNLLVASRTGSDSIHILEGENGNYLGSMDMTNVTGGVFAINLVSVANDGVIYGCNLTTTGAGFKFYRWGDESSAPTVAFEGDLDQRVGDSFTVIGSGANTIVYASGSNATKIYIFTTTDGISFSLFDEVPILSSLARGGIAPVADTLGSDIWVNCSGKQAALIDTGGTVITTIDTSMNTFFAHIDYFETGDGRKLIAVAGGNCGDVPACMRSEVWDVTNPFNPWRFAYGSMTNTPVANLNGTGIAILEEKEDGVLNLYHLLSNNGIALYSEEEFIPPILVDVTFEVNMSYQITLGNFNAGTDFVDVAGTFNDWGGSSIVMDDSDADSIYSVTVSGFYPSDSIEYKFRINGDWDTSEFPSGGPNRVYVIPDTNSVVFHWYNNEEPSVGIIGSEALPKEFALQQNYPNPFNPTTSIKYNLPKEAIVKIVIYDLMGREIRTLLNEKQNAGYKSIIWNGRDNNGQMVSSSMYIYQMITDEFQKTRKMMLLK